MQVKASTINIVSPDGTPKVFTDVQVLMSEWGIYIKEDENSLLLVTSICIIKMATRWGKICRIHLTTCMRLLFTKFHKNLSRNFRNTKENRITKAIDRVR